MARQVIATDMLIDEHEVDVEEECLKILALYQPVAGDLRFVAAVIKINSELERIGDLAANIAERALELLDEHPVPVPGDVARDGRPHADHPREGARRARAPGRRRWRAQVLAADDEIDDSVRGSCSTSSRRSSARDLEHLDAIVLLFSVARYLERLADHATNIAEDVLYMVEGEIQRHSQTPVAPGTAEELLQLARPRLQGRVVLTA